MPGSVLAGVDAFGALDPDAIDELLSDIFADRRIEDLRHPFFCVSTNLTTGAAVVHDRGPLAVWVGTSMAITRPGLRVAA
jgi:predicted acylesterase/phospholipase RssA